MLALASCTKAPHHQSGLDPQQTVQQYVEYINEKNVRGVESLYINPSEAMDGLEFIELEGFKLEQCREISESSIKNNAKVLLDGTYVIKNLGGTISEFEYCRVCNLLKDSTGDWKIESWSAA